MRLYPEQFLTIPLIHPPIEEQELIVAYINKETAQAEKAIIRANREIDLIREYRTRLIADVVTGKLDVRSVELPTQDETDILIDWDADTDAEAALMEESEAEADAEE